MISILNKPCTLISFLIILFITFFSFTFVDKDIEFPEPSKSRTTGYPTWHPELKDYDGNSLDSIFLFTIVFTGICSYLGYRWTKNRPENEYLITLIYQSSTTSSDELTSLPPVTSQEFNKILEVYTYVTFIATTFASILDIGKLCGVFALLHNSIEFVILVLIGSGGKIKSLDFYLWLIIYTLTMGYCIIMFEYPVDVVFFKLQEFFRIYFHTGHELKLRNRILGDDNEDLEELTESELNQYSYLPKIFSHPNQLWLLIFAAITHIIGNIFITLDVTSLNAYCLTYGAIIYYIYLDTHCLSIYSRKRLYFPKSSKLEIANISIISFALSLLTIRLAIFTQANENN
ncbi:3361_t:CDS:2 [Entrophospora sp. SA101]|nr:3361_t:CDS:2 [Entrophospora sp. SA101]